MDKSFELVRYGEDHYVLHLDPDHAAALCVLIGKLSASSEILGQEEWYALHEEFAKHDRELLDAYKDANMSLKNAGRLCRPHEEDNEDLRDTPLWKSFASGVPEDREEEVLHELRKALAAYGDKAERKEKPLNSAFYWSESPQGHTYWATLWEARSHSPE